MRSTWILAACALVACGDSNSGTPSETDGSTQNPPGADGGGDGQNSPGVDGGGDGDSGAGQVVGPPEETTCETGKVQCNGACLSAAGESGSNCVLVDTDLNATQHMVRSGGRLFYADATSVRSLDLASGTSTTLDAERDFVFGLAADTQYLYVLDLGSFLSILRMPVSGGSLETLVDNFSTLAQPQLSGSRLWLTNGVTLFRMSDPPGSGSDQQIGTGGFFYYLLDEQNAYVFEMLGDLARYSLANPQKEVLVAEGTHPVSSSGTPQQDANYVYWVEVDTLKRVPKAGGAPEDLHVFDAQVDLVSIDSGFLYVRDNSSRVHDRFFRVPTTGGDATFVASLQVGAYGQAVADGDTLYVFTRKSPEALLKIALPN